MKLKKINARADDRSAYFLSGLIRSILFFEGITFTSIRHTFNVALITTPGLTYSCQEVLGISVQPAKEFLSSQDLIAVDYDNLYQRRIIPLDELSV